MANGDINTTGNKMTPKDMFAYHKDNFINDERFIALDDNAKLNALSKFFDDAGVEYLTKQGLTDKAKIQEVKDQWVQKTIGTFSAPQKKKDLAMPDFGEGLLPEQAASQSSTAVIPNRNPDIQKDIISEESGKGIDELQSDLKNVNNDISKFNFDKAQLYKSPYLLNKEAPLETQYQSDISSGIPKEQAEMKIEKIHSSHLPMGVIAVHYMTILLLRERNPYFLLTLVVRFLITKKLYI